MQPTNILRGEHRTIERMLAVLQRAAAKLEEGERIDPTIFEKAVDFIRNYADRFHHAKEEDVLFRTMEAHGFPGNGGPIGVMLMEHEEGRAHVRGMDEALKTQPKDGEEARASLIHHARGFAELLSAHIYKEDNVLYPMGEQLLPPAVQERMLEQFETLERSVLDPDEHRRYLAMVEELEKAV